MYCRSLYLRNTLFSITHSPICSYRILLQCLLVFLMSTGVFCSASKIAYLNSQHIFWLTIGTPQMLTLSNSCLYICFVLSPLLFYFLAMPILCFLCISVVACVQVYIYCSDSQHTPYYIIFYNVNTVRTQNDDYIQHTIINN